MRARPCGSGRGINRVMKIGSNVAGACDGGSGRRKRVTERAHFDWSSAGRRLKVSFWGERVLAALEAQGLVTLFPKPAVTARGAQVATDLEAMDRAQH